MESTSQKVQPWDYEVTVSTSQDNYLVRMSLDMVLYTGFNPIIPPNSGYHYKAELQRISTSGYTTISTDSGYVTPTSSSHRSFTNIAIKGPGTGGMRLKISYAKGKMFQGSFITESHSYKTVYSNYFTR